MRGGYRQGAGRKQGFAAKEAEEARKLLSEMVAREIVPIGKALVKQAKAGNIAAAKELFDRAWGKAPQTFNGGFEMTENKIVISNMSAERFGVKPRLEYPNIQEVLSEPTIQTS